jgi:UDP-2-acetamido-3-amino-2,3-dideoxy-glucuronate N-acetyltransferase
MASPKIHPSAIIDEGVLIGDDVKIWHFVHLLTGVSIGDGSNIGQNVMIGPDVSIGKGCKIQNNVSLYKGVTLEDHVFCGPSCVFTNVLTPRAFVERKDSYSETYVEEGVTIGANATIVCGVRLGSFCMIGAGSVVTRDIPSFALVVGNPACQIGWVSREGERLDENLTCPRTGEKYELCGNRLQPMAS